MSWKKGCLESATKKEVRKKEEGAKKEAKRQKQTTKVMVADGGESCSKDPPLKM
jgi:hypothetical protein